MVPSVSVASGIVKSTKASPLASTLTPKLLAAGWDTDPHVLSEQRPITNGRIIPVGMRYKRKAPKKPDYLLSYRRDTTLAVVEAKASDRPAADGLQQAKDYAEMLDLKFAYATNGHEIIEFDYTTGIEATITDFPAPDVLWQRYCFAAGIKTREIEERVLTPYNLSLGKPPRYYQTIAINRAVEEILKGRQRLLLTMATGTSRPRPDDCWMTLKSEAKAALIAGARHSGFATSQLSVASPSLVKCPRRSAHVRA